MVPPCPDHIRTTTERSRVRHPFFASPRPLVFAHRGGARWRRRTRWRRSTTGWRSAPTASSWTCACRATARRGSPRSDAGSHDDVARPGDRAAPRTSCRAPACRSSPRCCVSAATVRVIVEIKVNDPEFGRLVVDELRRRRRGRARLPRRFPAGGAAAPCAPRSRRSPPAPRARKCGWRSTARGALAGDARRRTRDIRCRKRQGARASCRRGSSADAHRAGLGVQVWTVDDEADARRLLDWGVDALITDRPDLMVPLVRRFATEARP